MSRPKNTKTKPAQSAPTLPKRTTKKPSGSGNDSPESSDSKEANVSVGEPMTAPKSGVKVRMYRTGLGDCFLLAFRKGNGDPFHMLIDCGTFRGTPTQDNKPRIRAIATDIDHATSGKLDLLVITHEHWDHVSAFHSIQAQDIFDKIKLGELWMAWTENVEGVPLAKDLHEGRKAARTALTQVLEKANKHKIADSTNMKLVQKVMDFFGGPLAAGKKSSMTEEAMDWLRKTYGKRGKVSYPAPLDPPLALEGVDDVRIYILGPPKDRDLIKNYYNPWIDGQVFPKTEAMAGAVEAAFFAACGVSRSADGPLSDEDSQKEAGRIKGPFDERYRRDIKDFEAKAKQHANSKEHTNDDPEYPVAHAYFSPSNAWQRIETDWLEASSEFALQLDSATNNTSLAFAIEVGPRGKGHVLLFPGDAQVGNWLSWFGPVEAKDGGTLGRSMVWKGRNGEPDITAEDLLQRTVVYKVGHHGSHNATLTRAMELMGPPHGSPDLIGLLPVDEHVARQKAGYGEMPLLSLYEELLRKTKGQLLRNDFGYIPDDDDLGSPGSTFDKSLPDKNLPPLQTAFAKVTPLFFEFEVPHPTASKLDPVT